MTADSALLRAATALPDFPESAQRHAFSVFSRLKDVDGLCLLASRPDLASDVDALLGGIEHSRVRVAWLSASQRAPSHLSAASRDPRVSVRRAAAAHLSTPPSELTHLSRDASPSVLSAVMRNKFAPLQARSRAWASLAEDPARVTGDDWLAAVPAESLELAALCLAAAPTTTSALCAAHAGLPSLEGRDRLVHLTVKDMLALPDHLPTASSDMTSLATLFPVLSALEVLAFWNAGASTFRQAEHEQLVTTMQKVSLRGRWRPVLHSAVATAVTPVTSSSPLSALEALGSADTTQAQDLAVQLLRHSPQIALTAFEFGRHRGIPNVALRHCLEAMSWAGMRVLRQAPVATMRPSMVVELIRVCGPNSLAGFLRRSSQPELVIDRLVALGDLESITGLHKAGRLPGDVLAQCPATRVRDLPASCQTSLLTFAADRFRDMPDAWEILWSLAGEFDGSWSDLVAACRALADPGTGSCQPTGVR